MDIPLPALGATGRELSDVGEHLHGVASMLIDKSSALLHHEGTKDTKDLAFSFVPSC